MSDRVDRDRPELSSWQAQSLRLTAFPAEVASPKELAEWPGWEATFGNLPPNSASKERGQEVREEGEFEGSWLSFVRQPSRLDWVLQPKPEPPLFIETLPRVGSFLDRLPA